MSPTPPILVRRGRASDVVGIAAIDALCFDPAWDAESWRAELERPLSETLVALGAGDEQGHAGVLAYCLLWHVADELHLQRIAVAPERRREGLARALLERALASGRAAGRRCLLLEVGARKQGALALYQSLGGAIVGHRRGYYADGDDALLLTVELSPLP